MMNEDLIQVAPVETMEFEDDDAEESEVEIPDLPPIVPPGGYGHDIAATTENQDIEFTESGPSTVEYSGDDPVTDGLGGLFVGAFFVAAGWFIYRML